MSDELYKATDHINRQFVDRTDTINTARVSTQRIKTLPETVVVYAKDITSSDTLIFDHPVFGYWDDFNWAGDDDDDIFTTSVSRVINRNNTFIERFVHTDFINSSATTASVTVGEGVSFSSSDVLVTSTFAKDDTIYSVFDFVFEGTDTSNLSSSVISSSSGSLAVISASGSASLSKFYVTYS